MINEISHVQVSCFCGNGYKTKVIFHCHTRRLVREAIGMVLEKISESS